MHSTFKSTDLLRIFTPAVRKPFVIAEIGVNHNGSVEIGKDLIVMAKESGADAVKFQTFITEEVVGMNAPLADYQKRNTSEISQFDMIKKLELNIDEFRELKEFSDKINIPFLSTGFDVKSCNNVDSLGVAIHKIASGEITNGPLLYEISKFNKPIILSTGMSNLEEIHQALYVIAQGFQGAKPENFKHKIVKARELYKETLSVINNRVAIMHCTSNYPANSKEINISSVKTLKEEFKLEVGFSDHTLNSIGAIMGLSLGCTFFEKHVTLNKLSAGPDHTSSSNPEEFRNYIKDIKEAYEVLGDGIKKATTSELNTKMVARKSLTAKRKIVEKENFSEDNLCIKRPGTGISPMEYWNYIQGGKASKEYNPDDLIS